MAERKNRTMGLAKQVKRTPGEWGLQPLEYGELGMRVKALRDKCGRDRYRWERKYGSVPGIRWDSLFGW